VARYIGRHGTKRLAKTALISAVPPLILKTAANTGGLPVEVFDEIRAGSIADRSKLYQEFAGGPFFSINRSRPKRIKFVNTTGRVTPHSAELVTCLMWNL
jgi:non-heme chloroperoxidase